MRDSEHESEYRSSAPVEVDAGLSMVTHPPAHYEARLSVLNPEEAKEDRPRQYRDQRDVRSRSPDCTDGERLTAPKKRKLIESRPPSVDETDVKAEPDVKTE
jgi:hypothetical protein